MPSMFTVTLEHLGRVIYYNTKGRERLMDEIFDLFILYGNFYTLKEKRKKFIQK